MTPLEAILKTRLDVAGPMTVEQFMAEALGHPEHGYYQRQQPFGAAGDFTTAPEISQIFGELLGLWAAVCWQQMGQPAAVNLVEMGPGQGTLMADALRAANMLPAFKQALTVHFVETSQRLRKLQKAALLNEGVKVVWHDDLSTVPEGPTLLIANELLDALPIHQFQKTEKGWCERLVDWDEQSQELRFVLSNGVTPQAALIPRRVYQTAETGAVAEICPQAWVIAEQVAKRFQRQPGYAVFMDYGYGASAPGDTLQAVKDHQYHPVLKDVGLADLTAHVDFEAFMGAAALGGARPYGVVPQGPFLLSLGLEQRAQMLLQNTADPAEQASIASGAERLAHPAQMGELFKAVAIASPQLPPPPGFEA